MLGAIAGDIIGSVYEFDNIKTEDFELFIPLSDFTDDTVLTVATADCILNKDNYSEYYRRYFRRYPGRGYGTMFQSWASSDCIGPYNSYGNGSAMRVSPVGFAMGKMGPVLDEAKKSAEVTHDHLEGIKGAQSVASAVYLANNGMDKTGIRDYITSTFGYDLDQRLDDIRPWYSFDVTCQGSVPQAMIAFLESKCFEDAIRKAVSLGGDSDTIACITGALSEAFYGSVPKPIVDEVLERLDKPMTAVIESFYYIYMHR